MVDTDRVLTGPEALKLFEGKISKPTFYKALKDGTLPCLRLGRKVLIPRVALERLLNGEQSDEPGPAA